MDATRTELIGDQVKNFDTNLFASSYPDRMFTDEPDANDKKKVMLTEEEKKEFGNRFPKNYKRIKLLGK
jgi:hypothetical protein